MLFAAVFSVSTGAGGCGCPISDREVRMDVAFWNFSKNPPNYASVSDAMIFIMILNSTFTGPFSGGVVVIGVLLLGYGPSKKYPPDLMRASGYEM